MKYRIASYDPVLKYNKNLSSRRTNDKESGNALLKFFEIVVR